MERRKNEELTDALEREYYSFDALQLVAVIEELLEDTGGGRIFFEVDAGLLFPPSDVGYVEIDDRFGENGRVNDDSRIDDDAPGVTVRLPLMNLLGSSSPLPILFSDHITRGRQDAGFYADFLSIMQNRLHTLWTDACRKYSLWNPATSTFRPAHFDKFNASQGIAPVISTPLNDRSRNAAIELSRNALNDRSRNAVAEKIFEAVTGVPVDNVGFFDAALAGLWPLSNRARSAQGLKELLYSAFGDIPVSIEENAGRYAAISNARPLGGAARLGRNAALGTRVYDRTSKFRVTIGPLDSRTYAAFMPGGSCRLLIDEIASLYLNEPVICEITVTCRLSDLPRTRLGGGPSGGGNEVGRTAALGADGGGGLAAYSKQPAPG
jgi:predicted component of type VI protein secretion system